MNKVKKVLKGISMALGGAVALFGVGLGFVFFIKAIGENMSKTGEPIYWLYLAILIAVYGGVFGYFLNEDESSPHKYNCDRCKKGFTSDEPSNHIIKPSGDILDICGKCVDLTTFIVAN